MLIWAVLAVLIGFFGIALTVRVFYVKHLRKSSSADIKFQIQQRVPEAYDIGNIVTQTRNRSAGANSDDDFGYENEQPFHINDFDELDYRVSDKRGYAVAGIEAAGLFGGEIVHKYLLVDDYVYEGIRRLAGQQFDSFGDLSAKVQTYEQDFFGGLTEGSLRKVGGHIAEPYAANHFANAGLDVQWPDVSNQAGWDLLIEGHEVNVKLVADAEHLAKHFRDYPEIPAVVPGDMANIPESAVHLDPSVGVDDLLEALSSGQEKLVIVDDVLSHADVMEQTADATDALVGGAELVSSHVPWITLAFSGWREAKLLQSEKTDWLSATKNIGLDAAGTAGGSFAGAKTGAIIGTAIGGPGVGTVIGTVAGAIAGALGGRAITNTIKTGPFDQAVENFKRAREAMNAVSRREGSKVAAEFDVVINSVQSEMSIAVAKHKDQINGGIHELRKWRASVEAISTEDANRLFELALAEMSRFKQEIDTTLKSAGIFKLVVWPDITTISLQEAARKINFAISELKKEQISLTDVQVVDRQTIFETIAQFGLLKGKIVSEILKVETERNRREEYVRNMIDKSQSTLLGKRIEAMTFLSEKLTSFQEALRNRLKPYVEETKKYADAAKTEAQKLGRA